MIKIDVAQRIHYTEALISPEERDLRPLYLTLKGTMTQAQLDDLENLIEKVYMLGREHKELIIHKALGLGLKNEQ